MQQRSTISRAPLPVPTINSSNYIKYLNSLCVSLEKVHREAETQSAKSREAEHLHVAASNVLEEDINVIKAVILTHWGDIAKLREEIDHHFATHEKVQEAHKADSRRI